MEPSGRNRSPAAQDRVGTARHGPFTRFVEFGQRRTSGPGFFFVCLLIVVSWVTSYPVWHDSKSWQYVIHTVASVLTLLLVVLQENASRRANETAQEKLNVLAEGLVALMDSRGRTDPQLAEATHKLRTAIGLEGRH
jgi:hypothetical protein